MSGKWFAQEAPACEVLSSRASSSTAARDQTSREVTLQISSSEGAHAPKYELFAFHGRHFRGVWPKKRQQALVHQSLSSCAVQLLSPASRARLITPRTRISPTAVCHRRGVTEHTLRCRAIHRTAHRGTTQPTQPAHPTAPHHRTPPHPTPPHTTPPHPEPHTSLLHATHPTMSPSRKHRPLRHIMTWASGNTTTNAQQ